MELCFESLLPLLEHGARSDQAFYAQTVAACTVCSGTFFGPQEGSRTMTHEFQKMKVQRHSLISTGMLHR